MADEKQLLKDVLESASENVSRWPEWRRSDDARFEIEALKERAAAIDKQTEQLTKANKKD
jgi:hypothetical protein